MRQRGRQMASLNLVLLEVSFCLHRAHCPMQAQASGFNQRFQCNMLVLGNFFRKWYYVNTIIISWIELDSNGS